MTALKTVSHSGDVTVDAVSDLDAIHRVVATIERTQRNELVNEFLDLFDARAIWTTSNGVRLVGLPAIREFTEHVLPASMTDLQGTTYRVAACRASPDRMLLRYGSPRPTPTTREHRELARER